MSAILAEIEGKIHALGSRDGWLTVMVSCLVGGATTTAELNLPVRTAQDYHVGQRIKIIIARSESGGTQ